MNREVEKAKRTLTDRFLDRIERVCNRLPAPAILFFGLFVLTAVIGAVLTELDFTMVNPAVKDPVKAVVRSQNLFSASGVQWLLDNLVKNFTGYAPLGNVLVMTLAIGMCEESGFFIALLTKSMKNVPPALVPYAVAFIGTLGNLAADSAAIFVPPMAAIAYLGVGRHPVVGLINGYAAVQAGFTANLLIAGADALLGSITNVALKGFVPDSTFTVDVTANWYFLAASVFLCTAIVGTVCNRIVEPRFGKYVPAGSGSGEGQIEELTPVQLKGLRNAAISAALYLLLIAAGFFYGPLAKVTETGEHVFVGSPLIKGIIPVLFFFFAIPGITYGFTAGTVKNTADLNRGMVKQASIMGGYIVFCFFAGQFNMLFNWTKLGTMIAIGGANFLKDIGFTGIPMCVAFILMSGFVNIFMSSGSAKWAIFAPIFVPMFMLLGYHPAFTQLMYRLGDSPSNCFTPMSSYIWMVLSIAQAKYMKDARLGTLVANLIPIGIALQIAWIVFFVLWSLAGLPIGPGVYSGLPSGIL